MSAELSGTAIESRSTRAPKAPSSVLGPRTEGVTVNVPGIINFNHSAGGDNVYIQTS